MIMVGISTDRQDIATAPCRVCCGGPDSTDRVAADRSKVNLPHFTSSPRPRVAQAAPHKEIGS
jgi:hypothetical protein